MTDNPTVGRITFGPDASPPLQAEVRIGDDVLTRAFKDRQEKYDKLKADLETIRNRGNCFDPMSRDDVAALLLRLMEIL